MFTLNYNEMRKYFLRNFKLLISVFLVGIWLNLFAFSAQAFLFDTKILEKNEIVKLADEQLIETYLDVIVEIEALKTFYARGGLTPKEYNNFKSVLRYRIFLTQEIIKRGLEIPKTE